MCGTNLVGLLRPCCNEISDYDTGVVSSLSSPSPYLVSRPVFFAGRAIALKEILGPKHSFSALSLLHMVEVSIVVMNFLIWEDCPDSPQNSSCAKVSPVENYLWMLALPRPF